MSVDPPIIPVVTPVGERGPKGDHGQHGDDGNTGAQGERGRQGDHGQAGHVGETGAQGVQGEPGKPGESIGMLGWISRHAIALTLLLVLTVTAYGFQQSSNARDDLRQQAVTSDGRLCRLAVKSWDQRHGIIQTLTEPGTVSPAVLQLPSAQSEPIVLQIRQANERRARDRVTLTRLDGTRPRC